MSFDQYAKKWDTEKRIKRAKIIADEIRTRLHKAYYKRGMEFGCGTGLISFNLCDLFEELLLVDTSEGMIRILLEKKKAYNAHHFLPIKTDILKENVLVNKKVDLVYSSMVLHHIRDTKDILDCFYNMLTEKGELCIVDIDQEDGRFHSAYPEFDGHNGFDHQALVKIAESVGFKNIEINSFFTDTKVICNEKMDYSLFIMRADKG